MLITYLLLQAAEKRDTPTLFLKKIHTGCFSFYSPVLYPPPAKVQRRTDGCEERSGADWNPSEHQAAELENEKNGQVSGEPFSKVIESSAHVGFNRFG